MQKNLKKELPVVIQTKINCYLYHAFFLCIILSYKNLYNWFLENYIQLFFNPDKIERQTNTIDLWLDFYGGLTIPRQILSCTNMYITAMEKVSILEFVEECINNNCYLYTHINVNPEALKKPFVHDIFIYGYDKSDKSFSVIGYDKNRIFCSYKINYAMFENAFKTGIESAARNMKVWEEEFYAMVIKPKYDENYVYNFNLENFKEMLHDYIFSLNTHKRIGNTEFTFPLYENENNVYGIDVYNNLFDYMRNFDLNNIWFDFRPFHVLYEHKKALIERFNFLEQELHYPIQDFIDDYQQIVKEADHNRLMAISCTLNYNKKILDDILRSIEKQKSIEGDLLKSFYLQHF